MAADIFIKIGDIKGESTDDSHKDSIEVLSWSWGLSNAGSAHVGAGQGSPGKVSVSDLTITKFLDMSTPPLIESCMKGSHIAKAVLTLRKPSGDGTPLEFFNITMESVYVTSVSESGAASSGLPMESVSLNFAKVKVEYKVQQETGASGPTAKMAWDIRSHKAM